MKTCYRPSGPGWIPFRRDRSASQTFILDNYDQRGVYDRRASWARRPTVSESTVVRFAAQLGYDGYPADAEGTAGADPRQADLHPADTGIAEIRCPAQDMLGSVMQRDMNSIRNVIEQLDRDAFSRAVDKLLGARAHLYPGCAVLLISGGVSELLPAPDLQERDAGAVQRRR